MNDNDLTASNVMPPDLAVKVDAVCLRFEAAWKKGPLPRIEDYVEGWQGPELVALLRELVPLAVDYRQKRGERCVPDDSLSRFPVLGRDWLEKVCAASHPAALRAVSTLHARDGETLVDPRSLWAG